ncbi:MAG: hypothetical protein ACHQIM_06445 [Sphingobacteriales bacterium]
MRKAIIYIFIICALGASCSSAKKTIQNSATASVAGNDGSSYEKAIVIHEDHETQGIHAEYAWLRDKYPGYKTKGQSLNYYKNKPYDIIHIIMSDNKETDVYFDISNFYGKF